MNNFIINGKPVQAPEGIVVTNFLENKEPHFAYGKRIKPISNIVLHETAGTSAKRCKSTLISKGYGVQLILARDGLLSCHGDLATDRMVHANQLNDTSIGIEVVNPYAPIIAGRMNVQTISAEWWTWCPDKKDRRYVLPTIAQINTLVIILPWLCEKLNIPLEFPTRDLNAKKSKIRGWKSPPLGWRAKPGPGIVAHCDFAKHADGRYLLEQMISYLS